MSPRMPLLALALAVTASGAAAALADPVAPTPQTITIGLRGDDLRVGGHLDAPPGYTRVAFRARGTDSTRFLALLEAKSGRRVAAAALSPGDTYVTRIVLRDRRHVVIDSSSNATLSFRPSGDGAGLTPGPYDASMVVRETGIEVPDVLPRKGLIRIANRGGRNHALTAIHLRSGRHHELVGPVSQGTVNRVEAELPPGRYRLVSGELSARVEVI